MPASKKKGKSRSQPSGEPAPIPPGFGTVTAYLSVEGGLAAMEFYKKAFGAREVVCRLTPNGRLIHGQVQIGNTMLFLSDVFPDSDTAAPSSIGTTTVTLHIYTDDVDALWDRAVAAGARVSTPLENQYWGERYGKLVDPFGHQWTMSMQVKVDRDEMEAKRLEAEAAYAREERPSRSPRYGDA